MERISKKIFEYVSFSDLSKDQRDRFDLWIKTYNGQFYKWENNGVLLLEYTVYEAWVRHEEDNFLLTKLKEVLGT